jgi:aminoglycoside phosphotransferase (APT) family kinase protein
MADGEIPVDSSRLETYLSAELDADIVDVSVLHEALNTSLLVSTAGPRGPYVLRTPEMLRDTESFLGVREEYEVLARLQETAVDAPEPVLCCADESPVGARFLVMTHLEGEAVPLGNRLPERFRHPTGRRQVGLTLVDALADIHSVESDRFADICERTTPREQVVADIDRLDEATAVTGHDPPALWGVANWLREHAPTDPLVTLSHGDFRPGNVLFAGAEQPTLTGVLDWETAFLGDPRVELGYLLLRWRDAGDPTPQVDEIAARWSDEETIRELRAANEHGLAPFTSAPGSPDRGELVDRYERLTGIEFEHGRFYTALGAFMLAAVWADIHRHQVAAGASSSKAPWVEYMAMLADSIVSGEFEP